MNLQKAAKLIPARTEGGYHEVVLENGASLKGRTVILPTGARWRQMGVPGEEEYGNKGGAYCPHCDGERKRGAERQSAAVSGDAGGGRKGETRRRKNRRTK